MDTTEANAQMAAALDAIMKERDITQTEVGEVIGRSQSYISGRMTGVHHLSVDIILGVAHLAHLTPRALMVELTERMALEQGPGTATLPLPDQADDPR